MEIEKKRKQEEKTPATIKPVHKEIIDLYFSNGFNGTKAVRTVKPELSYNVAAREAHLILNSKANQAYVKERQYQLSKAVHITPELIAQELKGIATADITELIGLNEDEIKELGPELRRSIKRVQTKVKTYRYKDGSESTETVNTYELYDKTKALDALSKYIGFYEADNRQKQVNINLNKLDVHSLNNVLNLITGEDNSSTPQQATPQAIEAEETTPPTPQGV